MGRKIKSNKALILIFVLMLIISGCSESENNSDDKFQNTNGDYKIQEITFASNLALGEKESVRILGVKDSNIFIEIEKNIKNANDPMGIDTVSLADRLIIYDTKKEEIIYERKMEDESDCSSGILLEKGIAFIRMSMSNDSYGEYYLYHIYNGIETLVASAAGTHDVFYDPQLMKLLDDNFVYTYYNPKSNEFGLNIVTPDIKVKQIEKMIDGSEWKFMRSSLYGNGDAYIYFYDYKGDGWFLIGDKNGAISQFQLAKNERINSYCLLGERVLFSMNLVDPASKETGKLIMKTYKGEEISERNQETLYRMASNNKDIVIATDSFFENHIVRINNKDEITVQDLTVDDRLDVDIEDALDGTAVSIHYVSKNKFLLFFYGNKLKLVEVEVK